MKIPKRLQAVLWSVDVNHLNKQRDKAYIIHQIFSYGRLEDILWVFNTYTKEEIKKTFTQRPYKDYWPSRFYFVKNYLLGLTQDTMDERLYVKNTPRRLD